MYCNWAFFVVIHVIVHYMTSLFNGPQKKKSKVDKGSFESGIVYNAQFMTIAHISEEK